MQIREEEPADREAIRALNDEAFGGTEESRLIEALRTDGLAALSLVAVDQGSVIGHVLFSELAVEVDGREPGALALAPLAVAASYRRRGIGAALVKEGLRLARERGWQAVIVLGSPAYYQRFGFAAARARHLRAPFSGDAFMALELVPDALAGAAGQVVYPSAFDVSG